MSEGNLVRINKFLSEIGYCSRRAADTLVEEGRVKVNGVIAVMGAKITPDDVVMVDDKLVTRPKKILSTSLLINQWVLYVLLILTMKKIISLITSTTPNVFFLLVD